VRPNHHPGVCPLQRLEESRAVGSVRALICIIGKACMWSGVAWDCWVGDGALWLAGQVQLGLGRKESAHAVKQCL
jgi:hypothetical protein